MSIINSIVNYLSRKQSNKNTPENLCPNCWGHQEYEGKFLAAMQKENIDLNNLKDKTGWVQEYAVKHFEGIKLKETNDVFECPHCKLTYRPS